MRVRKSWSFWINSFVDECFIVCRECKVHGLTSLSVSADKVIIIIIIIIIIVYYSTTALSTFVVTGTVNCTSL